MQSGIVFLSVHGVETVVLHVDNWKLAAKALGFEVGFEAFLSQALRFDTGSLAVQLHGHPVVLCLDFDCFISPIGLVEGHFGPDPLYDLAIWEVE